MANDTFADFKKKVVKAILAYEEPEKLIGSMAKRIKECIARKGQMIDQ